MNKTAEKTTEKKTTEKTPSINLREMSLGRKDILSMNPKDIHVKEGFNVRKELGNIDELAANIKANGVKVPLRIFVEAGKIYLSDGHRRFAAIQMLLKQGIEIKSIPCIPEEKGIPEDQRTLGLITYNDGLPLTPLEEAEVIVRLMGYGWTAQMISEKTGRSQAHVSNAKILVKLPAEAKKEVQEGTLSSTFALELARKADGDHSKLKEMIKEGKEKAKAIGKNKVTKAIATKGTTKKTPVKAQKAELAKLLQSAIEAIRSEDGKLKADVIENIEEFLAELIGAATTAKK